MATRLHPETIRSVVGAFPASGDWQRVRCAELREPTALRADARNWSPFTPVGGSGGVYAFLFPKRVFAGPFQITLDGPARRAIPFEFAAIASLLVADDHVVAYVGRAARLLQRFHWHFSLTSKNTGAQVQYGLVKSGLCQTRQAAVTFMLDHGTIAYHILSGDDHVANRDIVEVSLSGKFMAPFNIKSEH